MYSGGRQTSAAPRPQRTNEPLSFLTEDKKQVALNFFLFFFAAKTQADINKTINLITIWINKIMHIIAVIKNRHV